MKKSRRNDQDKARGGKKFLPGKVLTLKTQKEGRSNKKKAGVRKESGHEESRGFGV